MIDHLDTADLGEAHAVIMGDAKTRLREGETIVAVSAAKTGKPRRLSCFHTAEEGFEGQINPHGNVLQDLGMHALQGRALFFEQSKCINLSIASQALPLLLIGSFAHLKQMVIEPSTLKECFVELTRLLLIRIDTILEHFMHTENMAQNIRGVKWEAASHRATRRNGALIPRLKHRGFLALGSIK